MRSVHTLASVHAQWDATSLPCLARGTPGRFNCFCASLTPPPSCPPSLHGHYPLPRYYGDSDSCPAPSSTGTGILDSRTCTCGHSVSNHLLRPRSGNAFGSGRAWPPTRLGGYRRIFGFRSLPAVSSVARGRIEFVLCPSIGTQFYGLSIHRQLLSTVASLPRSYFQLLAFSSAREGLPPSCARSLSSALPTAANPPIFIGDWHKSACIRGYPRFNCFFRVHKLSVKSENEHGDGKQGVSERGRR